ncbi:hypothetical protein GJ496_005728 [Pomphorhynchus laevis]|nr:hypothetical protein GJ496_005728 [Pomphorhynchus laevis]
MFRTFKLLLLLTVFKLAYIRCGQPKILIRDVQTLTFHKGDKTTFRRSSPISQLKCVGGSNKCRYLPHTVQCYNRGSDGKSIQWECHSDLPSKLYFGKLTVNCEGYDYPEDPYVLVGSCGLTYMIEHADKYSSSEKSWFSSHWFWLACAAVIIWIYLKVIKSPYTHFRQWGGGGSDNFGGGGRRPNTNGNSYGFRSFPSSYFSSNDDSCNSSIPSSGGFPWSGFLSGMTLGALGTSIFSRPRNTGYTSPLGFGGYSSNYRLNDNDDNTVDHVGYASTTGR